MKLAFRSCFFCV